MAEGGAEAETMATGGPVPGVSYPLTVHYCGECSLPLEYCENGPCPDRCRSWLQKNMPGMLESLPSEEQADGDGDGDGKKRQKRGGKGGQKAPKQKAPEVVRVTLQRSLRGKHKSVTVIKGLTSAGIDLKVASKFFSQKFACGSSVTTGDEIVVQGDVKDDLFDIIPEKWPQIDEDDIEDLGDQKR